MTNIVNKGEAQGVEQPGERVVDVFAQFEDESLVSESRSREDIIKELIASGNAKRLNGLTVRNVIATDTGDHSFLTFVIQEYVIGDVRDNTQMDAFGEPIRKLGKTHNVQTSVYAVAGVMKDSPKLAIFASNLVDNPALANMLFAGSKIDVVMQYAPKDVEYTNPFASNPEPTVFARDKMIHHVVRLELGEVGLDMYRTMLLK